MPQSPVNEDHPATLASRESWRCVQAGDKEGWLAVMADDVCIEDPIGKAPTNPTGEGVRGKDAVRAFWDQNIGPSKIAIEVHESYASSSPNEAAHLMTLTTTLPNGTVAKVRGIFAYRTNDAGKLTNLRGWWNLSQMQFS